jgi:tRNA nucleotidyltransferase/poly(A) polymerase
MFMLNGFQIDLTSLSPKSFDPVHPNAIGTPLEDTSRRDITINALYYNLQTRQIEDNTTQGFDDLQNKIIRTTIAPYNTFVLNPLRILRVLRFACRLNFSLHPDIMKCLQEHSPLLAASLKDNIVHDRKTLEMNKMLMDNSYQSFVRAVYFLHKWKVLPTILLLPDAVDSLFKRRTADKPRQLVEFHSTTPEGRKNRELFYAGGVRNCLFAFMILPLLNGQQSFEGKQSFLSNYQFDSVKSKISGLLINPEEHKLFV